MMKIDISFERLPLWQGVQEEPGVKRSFPFHLGWDPRGFISQTTEKHILEQVFQTYAEEDYTHSTKPPGASEWANHLGNRKIKFVEDHYGSLDKKNIIEIGAGSLYISEKLTDKYRINQYVVIDPSIKRRLAPKENIKIIDQYFDKKKSFVDKIDLVMGFSVLEHVPDPIKFLLDLNSSLYPVSGKAILSFPDTEQLFKNGDLNVIIHEHTNYLTLQSAKRLFDSCGFTVLSYENQSDVLWFLVEADKEPLPSQSYPMGEELPLAALRFHQNLLQISQNLNSLLNQGKHVAIHGCSNGLNNLFYLCDLDNIEHLHIFDSDTSKTGKYLPASSRSVQNSMDSKYKTMDFVFIAALSFYPEIKDFLISKHEINENRIQSLYPTY